MSVGPPFLIFLGLTVLIFAKPWRAIEGLPLWIPGLIIEVKRDNDTDVELDIAGIDSGFGRQMSPATAENRGHELVVCIKFKGMRAVHPGPRRLLMCTLAPLLFVIMNFWDYTVITQIGETKLSVLSACTGSNTCFYTSRDVSSMQFTPLTLDLSPVGHCNSFAEMEVKSKRMKSTYSVCFSFVFSTRLFFQSIAITTAQLVACTMLVCYAFLPAGSLEEEKEGWCALCLPSNIFGSVVYLLLAAGALLANVKLYGSYIQTFEGFLILPCLLLLAASLCEAKRCAGKWVSGATPDVSPTRAGTRDDVHSRLLQMETMRQWSGQEPHSPKWGRALSDQSSNC